MNIKEKDIPFVGPNWSDIPWAIAFTTVARDKGIEYNYRAGNDENRNALNDFVGLEIEWLTLNHGDNVVTVPCPEKDEFADAAIVTSDAHGAAITTADCLPVILLSPSSKTISVVHAGWRGVVNGVTEKTVKIMSERKGFIMADLRVWIGPSVRNDYEIMQDVRDPLLDNSDLFHKHIMPINNEKYLADLPGILIQKLTAMGIRTSQIEVFPESTIKSDRFYSVRTDGYETGRIATVVGII